MAKLLDVKVIDMVGGEVTKVEYAGETYVMTDVEAQYGDIIRKEGNGIDTTDNAYYKVIEDGPFIKDDNSDRQSMCKIEYETFRKTSATSTPIEKRVDELETRVDAIAKAVKAEGETKSEESFEVHDGKVLRKVSRKSKTGDYIRFRTSPNSDTPAGKLFEVFSGKFYRDDSGSKLFVTGWSAQPEVFEVVTPIEGPAQVGDKIVIVNAQYSGGEYKNGDVFTVSRHEADSLYTSENVEVEEHGMCIFPKEFAIVERPEAKPYKPSEGDIVVITANTNGSRNKVGDIGKVGSDVYETTARVHVPSRPFGKYVNGNYTYFYEMRPATPSEIAQYEKDVAEAKRKAAEEREKRAITEQLAKYGRKPGEFKKGDIVLITEDNADGSINEKGEIGEIRRVDSGRLPYDVRVSGRSYSYDGWHTAKSIELITPVEARIDRIAESA